MLFTLFSFPRSLITFLSSNLTYRPIEISFFFYRCHKMSLISYRRDNNF